jgi:hypothetical protein
VEVYAAEDTTTELTGTTVINNSTKYVLSIDISAATFNDGDLTNSDEGAILITTPSGAVTRVEVSIPANVQDDTVFL